MDWTLIVSGAITGAVGVGGVIAGAKIAGKSARENLQLSISAENDRQHKAEKRQVYAACLAVFTEMTSTALAFAVPMVFPDKVVSEDAKGKYDKAFDAMITIVSQAHLIAPREVRDLLTQNVKMFEVLGPPYQKEPPGPINVANWTVKVGGLRDDLGDAMRADLEKPSALYVQT